MNIFLKLTCYIPRCRNYIHRSLFFAGNQDVKCTILGMSLVSLCYCQVLVDKEVPIILPWSVKLVEVKSSDEIKENYKNLFSVAVRLHGG